MVALQFMFCPLKLRVVAFSQVRLFDLESTSIVMNFVSKSGYIFKIQFSNQKLFFKDEIYSNNFFFPEFLFNNAVNIQNLAHFYWFNMLR